MKPIYSLKQHSTYSITGRAVVVSCPKVEFDNAYTQIVESSYRVSGTLSVSVLQKGEAFPTAETILGDTRVNHFIEQLR